MFFWLFRAVDIWSTGFIVAEMISGVPLAPGDSEINQLYKIFQIFGTPSSSSWPGIAYHPNYEMEWPIWQPKPLRELLPRAVAIQIDLIKFLCRYKPGERLTAKRAMQLPMFDFLRNKAAGSKPRATGLLSVGAASAANGCASFRRRQTMAGGSFHNCDDNASLPSIPTPVAAVTLSNSRIRSTNNPAFADASVYYSTPEYSFSSGTTGISSQRSNDSGRSGCSGSAPRPVYKKSKLLSSSAQRLSSGANDSGFGSSGGKKPSNVNGKRHVCFVLGENSNDNDRSACSEADDSMSQPFIGTDSFYAGKRHCAKTSVAKPENRNRYAAAAAVPACSTTNGYSGNFERSFSSRPASRSSTDGLMTKREVSARGTPSINNVWRATSNFCVNETNFATGRQVDDEDCCRSDDRYVNDGDISLDTSIGDEMLLQQQQPEKYYEMHNKHHQNSTFLGSEGAREAVRDRTHGLLQRSMSNAACWPKDMLSSSFRS